MRVYIETVILDNLLIDYVILFLTKLAVKCCVKKCRTFLAIFVAVAAAVLLPLFELDGVIATLAKIALGFLIVFIAFGKKNYFLAAMYFYLFTFIIGGAAIGIFYIFEVDFSLDSAFKYNYEFPIGIVIFAIFLSIFCVYKLLKRVKKTSFENIFERDVEIIHKGKSIKLKGYLDSGNFLIDEITLEPIIITTFRSVESLNINLRRLDRLDYYSSTMDKNTAHLFQVEKMLIYDEEKPHIFYNVMLGLIDDKVMDGKYDMLISPQFVS